MGALPAEAGPQSDAKQANVVFVGTVSDVSRTPKQGEQPATATYDVQVERVYKGSLSSENVQVVSSRTSQTCRRLDLDPDREYVFLRRERRVRPHRGHLQWHSPASGRLVARVVAMLGEGRPPVPAPPEQAEFHRVADAEPPTLTRTAAPGIALILVGLLGLGVVRRVGSRG